jgi:molybdopterin converting factor subunit 1
VRVKVVLFARAREAYGEGRAILDLPPSGTARDCFEALTQKAPALEKLRSSLLIAINERYGDWDGPLTDGDEVAFIPPVSGG